MADFRAHYLKAGHPETKTEDLRVMARHEHYLVRLRVAEHKSTPDDVLDQLLNDANADVVLALSDHPNLREESLLKLLQVESVDVLYGLAENPNISLPILQALIEHENPYVSGRAQRTVKTLQCSRLPNLEPHAGSSGGAGSRRLMSK